MDNFNNVDNQMMKELFTNSLRRILKNLRTATIAELAETAHIEYDTAADIVTELCRSGEFEKSEGKYRFNGANKLILAICVLGKEGAAVVVSDLYGEFIEKEYLHVNLSRIKFFDDIVERCLRKYPAISLLAFGMAGFEEKRGGRLLMIDFPDLLWVDFRNHFMEKYGLPGIVTNDINAAALGYYENKNLGEGKCLASLYISGNHHPGLAICIDGKLHLGKDNAAGEVIFLDTDIRWRHFSINNIDFSTLDIYKLIVDIAVPVIALLNPDRLVIYGKLPDNTEEVLHERLFEAIPHEFHPVIEFIPDILPDFLDGIIYLALQSLEPKIEFKI
jgi:predicted NBD/HSP70 family sugar kinase